MWILPKNYQLSSLYAPDMVESKEDLTLQELNIESSLMWRSKPSLLRTWLPRWKRVSWMPHLCGRILKPCRWIAFEIELTSSLAVILASLSQQQESGLEKKTPDTSGLTSATSSEQLDLFGASLKTSKDTSLSDSERSLATWKALVIQRRGEYSQRVKSAHLIRESESTLWRTPAVSDPGITLDRLQTKDGNSPRSGERLYDKETVIQRAQYGLTQQVQMEPTQWLTPRVMEVDESYDNYQRRMKASGNPKNIGKTRPANLTMQVKMEPTQWLTPDALPNAAIGEVGTDIVSGHLNPDWVEWLMGVPTGWTALDFWETE